MPFSFGNDRLSGRVFSVVIVMSSENPGATCGVNSNNADINSSLKELLLELRSQKGEINSLKEELRGNSQSVASEVKKLKAVKDIHWRFEGNRLQFDFNSELEDSLKQAIWALENGKREYAFELLNDSCEKLKVRNKHIRIADTSEGGWETVRQYVTNPLASDSDDESRLNRAESRAVKKKKEKQKSKSKSRASASFGYSDHVNQRVWGGAAGGAGAFPTQFQTQPVGPRFGSFRGFPVTAVDQRTNLTLGPCYACGEYNHIRRTCPYTKSAPQQQPELPANK